MIVGITGGIGCGKSSAAKELERLGYRRVDSDQIVHEKVLSSSPVQEEVRQRWGGVVFAASGQIDRKELGRIVFGDDDEREALENIVLPEVYRHWREALESRTARERWVFEVPLLFEKQLENWFDFTVCVASSPAVQLARLTKRGMDQALAEQRISKQLPLARKIELADLVVWNDGSLAFLHQQLHALDERWNVALSANV